MILNHKKALDYIRDKKSDFKKLSPGKIENIHRLIINDLGVKKGLRDKPVGIIGTDYKPLDAKYQIKEAVEKLIKAINTIDDPFARALIIILMVSYIQPFEDGNKRTARILADAILLAGDICPISYRSIDEVEYKKATILFYEQNSAHYFKKLFIEQYKFAINNYFGAWNYGALVSASDILPEAHRQKSSYQTIALTILGVAFIFFISRLI